MWGLYVTVKSFCLSVRLFVRLFVACEICSVIRYAAAPGGERGLLASTPDTPVFDYYHL